jgi:hypothetical protein
MQMAESLASFRDLKGIGPATEARLHETGIYTWEALATAATALASVRDNGDTPREIANAVAALRAEAGEDRISPRPPGGAERLEAFVLRMSLTADGEPQRSEVTHVRTMAEEAWPGWRPAELTGFLQEHAGIREEPAPAPRVEPKREPSGAKSARQRRRRREAPPEPASSNHVVVLDAGKTIGGTSRDVQLLVTNAESTGGGFDYKATLAARQLGHGQNGGGWTSLASQTGTGSPGDELSLGFTGLRLPPGIHRLRLRLEVDLPTPTRQPPALQLASVS